MAIMRKKPVRKRIARKGEGYLYSAFLLHTSAATPVDVAIAVGDRTLFSTARGGTGQGFGTTALTELETNVENAGRIPDEMSFKARNMGFLPEPLARGSQQLRIARQGVIKIDKPEYKYTYGPAFLWPCPVGIAGHATTAGIEFGGLGGANPTGMRRLSNSIKLGAGQSVKMIYSVPTAYTILAAEQTASQQVVIYIVFYGLWISKV